MPRRACRPCTCSHSSGRGHLPRGGLLTPHPVHSPEVCVPGGPLLFPPSAQRFGGKGPVTLAEEVGSVSLTHALVGLHLPTCQGRFRCQRASGPVGDSPKNEIWFIHSLSDSLMYSSSPNTEGAPAMCQPSAADAETEGSTSSLCGRRVERSGGSSAAGRSGEGGHGAPRPGSDGDWKPAKQLLHDGALSPAQLATTVCGSLRSAHRDV